MDKSQALGEAPVWQWDGAGWLEGVGHIPSPNFDSRPEGARVSLAVVHSISLPPGEFGGPWVADFFTNRLDPVAHPYFAQIHGMEVSSHFFVRRDGQVIQFVSCDDRAWHAGKSEWQGVGRCNDFSVGIELEGYDSDRQGFTPAQYASLNRLLAALARRYPITGVAGHSHIAPGRKNDPGPCFDWTRVYGDFPDLIYPEALFTEKILAPR